MGDQRGQAVVVAEADLVVGDGVVLVDDRHHAEVEQHPQGLAGVQVLLAVDEVEGRQQHLAADQPVASERPVVVTDQVGLARPPRRPAARPGRWVAARADPRTGKPGRDRPARHDHDPVPRRPAARPPRRTASRWPRAGSRPAGRSATRSRSWRRPTGPGTPSAPPARRRARTRTRTRRCGPDRRPGPPPGPGPGRRRGRAAAPGRRPGPRGWSGRTGPRPARRPGPTRASRRRQSRSTATPAGSGRCTTNAVGGGECGPGRLDQAGHLAQEPGAGRRRSPPTSALRPSRTPASARSAFGADDQPRPRQQLGLGSRRSSSSRIRSCSAGRAAVGSEPGRAA